MSAGVPSAPLEAIEAHLLRHAAGREQDAGLARMLASRACGRGALPPDLGLGAEGLAALLARHFPGFEPGVTVSVPRVSSSRFDEREELIVLLCEHARDDSAEHRDIAVIVATACLGNNHLWEDLGLWCRADLTRLLTTSFPTLVGKNVHDMKWKKFLYKQLCEREGLHLCRAPSCAVCPEYAQCFGPEE
jgi:nitrogen fixation protein NifQ